ncbi:MAG TPA: helix-turn-helix transcriptional regulator [Gaiellaceae bacterium]|nr:helix-turn-helix transcriptional regulator [Gaiellaceae bacterium]
MTDTTAVYRTVAAAPSGARLGDRLRLLRVAAGLTQTELAGDRFSKEYVSQIERGKTRPTAETVAWLAERLNVDRAFLTSGVSTDERGRVEAALARAEALSKGYQYKEAVAAYEEARTAVSATNSVELDVRTRSGEAWARMQEGDVRIAIELLNGARALAEGSVFSDVDRAEIVFRLGVCRYKLSSISTAVALLDEALTLAASSELPCDGLRSDIYHWRSRCHRRQRDFEAAREDVEHALELAQGVDDRRKMADAYFQASLVAERTGHWLLSRNYAERAKNLFQELDDERTVGRLLNNLGGLSLLLGKPHQAIEQLKASFAVAVEVDSKGDAAQAMGGLATVHLRLGDWDQAEHHAREALRLLDGREDFLDVMGQAQLELGRSLLERDRFGEAEEAFRAADATFEQFSSISHRANVWVALGDLAARRGEDVEAARLYRNAAEALQDLRF